MINISIDEKDKHVLRITASYFLALAGDISAEIVKDEKPTPSLAVPKATGDNETFTKAELAEEFKPAPDPLDPAVLFAKSPAAVPSIADAEALPTAPVDTPAITSIPTPPNVPSPPAVPAPSAAAPAVPPTGNPAANVELDVRGLPWDARIHSRTKSKLANGEWKVARNTDPALVTQVENELSALVQPNPVAVPLPQSNVDGFGLSVPAPPQILVIPNPANDVVIVPPGALTLPDFMRKVSELITAGRLPQPQFIAILNSHGLGSTTEIMSNQDKLPAINASVDEFINGAPV
jgi:hypothetical protein